MILADTNILLRLLLRDDPPQQEAVERYLTRAQASGEKLLLHPLVIAEVVWMLGRRGWERAKTVDALLEFCAAEQFEVLESDSVKAALEYYLEGKVSFVDAFQAAYVSNGELQGILSFDRDFDELGVNRIEPD